MPGPEAIFAALDATWPAQRKFKVGQWCLREGAGGGQRVSAATAQGPVQSAEIGMAEAEMRSLGQPPLFMIRHHDDDLDAQLAERGYAKVDPTCVYCVAAQEIAQTYPITAVIPAWPPLAIQREIWRAGGVNSKRVGVMERAAPLKTSFLARIGDTPAATVFAATSGGIAMVHALEVRPSQRRLGLGDRLVRASAHWATRQGSEWLALAVTIKNTAANALYTKIGMEQVTGYHYRRSPGVTA